jgi:hypothetical protein
MKTLSTQSYEVAKKGISVVSMGPVTIIGEQTVELEDGRVIEQYLYNIDGYTPENGKPFAALKANIVVEEPTLESLVGQTFKNEVELERAVKQIIGVKEMLPVLEGFWIKTPSGKMIKVYATSTIGELKVTKIQ